MRGRRPGRLLAALLVALVAAAAAAGAAAAPGDPDPGFDVDGRVTFGYGGDDRATDAVVLRDGRIVTAGWTTADGDIEITRLTRRGSLDRAFGRGGTSEIELGGDDRANAIAVQPDGRLVIAGRTSARAGEVAVMRLRSDGSLDRSFGRRGVRLLGTPRGDAAYDVAIGRDGRIVVAGDGGAGGDMLVARLTPRGALDRSFGHRGMTRVDFGGIEIANALALARDGRIVLAGATTEDGDIAVARLRPDGRLDPSFGARGRVRIDAGGTDVASAVALRPDGRILVAGTTSRRADAVVARLRPDGALDRAFGDRGLRRLDFGGDDEGFDMATAPGGRIVVAGRGGPRRAMAVARLLAGGALDPAFGRRGRATVDFPGLLDTALAVDVERDGRVVLAGSSDVQVAVARLRG
jgi:uncharacterized delta-60 repeat protein